MEARVDVPLEKAIAGLKATGEAAGFLPEPAGAIAQSAWHLHNRGFDGVLYLWRYLNATQDKRADLADIWGGHTSFRTIALPAPSPFARCLAEIERLQNNPPQSATQPVEGTGIAAPLLALPILVHALTNASTSLRAVEIVVAGHTVTMEQDGISVIGNRPDALMDVDARGAAAVSLSYVSQADRDHAGWTPKTRYASLPMLAERLQPDGSLSLDTV